MIRSTPAVKTWIGAYRIKHVFVLGSRYEPKDRVADEPAQSSHAKAMNDFDLIECIIASNIVGGYMRLLVQSSLRNRSLSNSPLVGIE